MAEPIQRKSLGRKYPHDITVTLNDEQRDLILKICRESGLVKTEVFRLALEYYGTKKHLWANG